MDDNEQDNVLAFDTLFTNNRIQILKVLLPYFDSAMQKQLAVYIKYQELQYTMTYFQKYPYHICSGPGNFQEKDIRKICSQIIPYCTSSEKKQMEQIMQMFQSMEMYQEMMQTMELMKEMMPEGTGEGEGGSEEGGFNLDMLSALLGPEQMEMFEMLKGGMKT